MLCEERRNTPLEWAQMRLLLHNHLFGSWKDTPELCRLVSKSHLLVSLREEVFIDEDLARLSFQTTPVYVNVDDGRTKVTNKGLQRGYCVMPSAKESVLLFSFLKKNLSKKVMVFFSSCNSVKCHSELLGHIQVDCLDIHGKQKQQKQTSTFFDFCKVEKGILLCTDVAAHGLDILDVDWMCQKVSKVKSGRGTHSCMACMVTSGPHATYCSITFVSLNDFLNPIFVNIFL